MNALVGFSIAKFGYDILKDGAGKLITRFLTPSFSFLNPVTYPVFLQWTGIAFIVSLIFTLYITITNRIYQFIGTVHDFVRINMYFPVQRFFITISGYVKYIINICLLYQKITIVSLLLLIGIIIYLNFYNKKFKGYRIAAYKSNKRFFIALYNRFKLSLSKLGVLAVNHYLIVIFIIYHITDYFKYRNGLFAKKNTPDYQEALAKYRIQQTETNHYHTQINEESLGIKKRMDENIKLALELGRAQENALNNIIKEATNLKIGNNLSLTIDSLDQIVTDAKSALYLCTTLEEINKRQAEYIDKLHAMIKDLNNQLKDAKKEANDKGLELVENEILTNELKNSNARLNAGLGVATGTAIGTAFIPGIGSLVGGAIGGAISTFFYSN